MTADQEQAFEKLLATFKATWLGEGDTNAGANLLAAMAVTLANLSRTGSGVHPPNLSRMRTGISLLVSGSLSPSLVMDDIVAEIGIRQNVLIAQIRRLVGDKVADAREDRSNTVEFPQGPKSNYAENALYRLEQREPQIPEENTEEWRDVLSVPPNPRIDDLAAQPKFLVTARGPKDLERRLAGIHDNRPLVVLGLSQPKDAEAYASICKSLLNGPVPVGELGETAGGHLLVCDPAGALPEIACKGSERAAWLGRTVWLVDGTEGPDATENHPAPGKIHVDDMAARFGEALTAVLGKRLDNHDAGTVVHELDLARAQIRWVAFLKEMAGQLPGITGTARALFPTLTFGLIELANAPNCERLRISAAEVEAFARWIVERMARARSGMLFDAHQAWELRCMRRIFDKLAGGPLDERSIYHPLHLQADFCRYLLAEMAVDCVVRRIGREWGQIEGATFPPDPAHRLPLEA